MTGLVDCPACAGSGEIEHGNRLLDPEGLTYTKCSDCDGVGSVVPSQAAAINRRIEREYRRWGAL
jgi:DnaJ-class molecular chaperone